MRSRVDANSNLGVEVPSSKEPVAGKSKSKRTSSFPESEYLANFPDVARSVKDGQCSSGYTHYMQYGRDEIAAGLRHITPGLQRTLPKLRPGSRSLREVHATADSVSQLARFDEIGDEFFEELYLELNPDVAAAVTSGQIASGYSHWLQFGRHELAQGTRSTVFGPPVASIGSGVVPSEGEERDFNAFGYFCLYPDVLKHLKGNPVAAWDHWKRHGQPEGRIAPGLRRSGLREISLRDLAARPFGINIFGAFAAQSGLGTAARGIAKAIKTAGIPFELWPFDLSDGEVRPAAHKAEKKPKYRINLLLSNADQVGHIFKAYPPHYFDAAYNIAVWQWELASFRPDWFYAFDGLDEVWTNSQFQLESIRSIAPVPVTKIHIPVVPQARQSSPSRASFGIPENAYVFFVPFDVGSSSVRKNPFVAIEAFRRLRAAHDNIHLVLKYHSANFEHDFIRKLMAGVRGIPNITVISSALDTEELDALRASCDCLISPHRSEGFGLNIAEFMSLGKAVIATAYSGNLDFFDEAVGFPLRYTLVEVDRVAGPYRPGYVWAEPDLSSVIEEMERVLTDPDEVGRRCEKAVRRIADLLSLEQVGANILARLNALQLNRDLPVFVTSIGRSDTIVRRPAFASRTSDLTAASRIPGASLLSIVMPVFNVPGRYLYECVESVRRQTYPFWELCICNDGSSAPDTLEVLDALRGSSPMIKIIDAARNHGIANATNRAVEIATGEFVVLLDNDDVLAPTALEEIAAALGQKPDLDVIYSDEDKIDEDGNKIDHFFKPDWSPEHLESVMYVLHMLVIRKALLLELGGLRAEYDGAQDYDLMLRCSLATHQIHHIPKALYHWRAIPGSAAAVVDAKPTALKNGMRALASYAERKYGSAARVEPGLLTGTFRLRRPLTQRPRVSLLILTGNAKATLPDRGELVLVDNFVDSILEKTDYSNYEIIVVDNGTLKPKQRLRFASLGVRVENFKQDGQFNYAAKANFAVRCARTENIVLLNDDMEVIRGDWLTSLIELSQDPEIGAVGARLLHFDGSVQHVGMVLGVNNGAAHVYHCYPREFVGYNAFTHIIRNYSCVTAACLATRKSVVAQAGGFDENFAIDYNDVDFCLRIGALGYRVVYTPYAELYHYESASARRTEQNPAEVERFQQRWASVLEADPYYNCNLTRVGLDFAERVSDPPTPGGLSINLEAARRMGS